MRPSVGHLLEVAWAVGSADQSEPIKIESRLVQLPNEESIPWQIQSITGIKNGDMVKAITPEELYKELKSVVAGEENVTAIIHYAQFERPFLEEFFSRFEGETKIPFDIVCSAQISRRIFPSIPSRNIRAIAGFFGTSIGELKRASSHVEATFSIWKELVRELAAKEITELGQLQAWLEEKPAPIKKEKKKYEYRLDKDVRLKMPDKPGIYRMLSKNGDVLYVGKATSLKSRVNSYFRGQKNRDRKKLEMLSQVWDIRITECGSALEAAVLETDEIKRLDPPYNISLKAQRHPPIYYSKDFASMGIEQSAEHPLGPFRGAGSVEHVRLLRRLLLTQKPPQVFYVEIEDEVLTEGFILFCQRFNLRPAEIKDVRKFLAFGMLELRKQIHESKKAEETLEEEILEDAEETESTTDDAVEADEEVDLTPEDLVGKFHRLAVRAAAEYRRSRVLTKLLYAKVSWETKSGWASLHTQAGQISSTNFEHTDKRHAYPWAGLGLQDYDRMSVLLSELIKYPHRIETSV